MPCICTFLKSGVYTLFQKWEPKDARKNDQNLRFRGCTIVHIVLLLGGVKNGRDPCRSFVFSQT